MFALNVLLTRVKSVAISEMGKLISHLLYQWENNLSRGLRYNEKFIFSWRAKDETAKRLIENEWARNWSAFRMIWDRLSVWLDRKIPMK